MLDGKRRFFLWGGTVTFTGTESKCRIVHEGWSSHSECIPVLLCHLWWEKKYLFLSTQTSLDHFSNRDDKIKSSKVSEPVPSTVSKHKIAAFRLLLLMIFQLYHLLPLLHPPVSNSSCLFTWCQPLYAGCCTGPLSFSRDCKIKNVFFIFCVCLLCIICVKIITNLL